MRCGVPAWALHLGGSVSMRACTALCIAFDDGPQLERCCCHLMKHAGGWLQWRVIITLSLICLRIPSHSLPLSSVSCSSPIQHARSSVTPSLLSRLPITHTVSARQLLPRKLIRLLGTWSCAHNSHFVAWKHAHTHSYRVLTKTALLNQQVQMNSYKSYTLLINKRFAYAAVRNHRVVNKSIYHRHLWKQANTLQNFARQCFGFFLHL